MMHITKKLSFMIAYLFLSLPFIGYWLGGMYNFLSFYVIFIGIPLIDGLVRDGSNPTSAQEVRLLKESYFKFIVYLYPLVQCCCLIVAIYLVSVHQLLWYEWLGFSMSMGLIAGGIGITLAHELMHKNHPLPQLLSKFLLVMVCYGHFVIEHVRGHHVRVATPEDPASARLGENLYHFLPRSIIGSWCSAWQLEVKRLRQKQYAVMSYHNQFWWIISLPVIIAAGCYFIGGWSALLFFLLQAGIAILLLEIVNYVEHYGLERQKLANGYYERVSACHSWNANHWLSNMLLFHLQRHSDHHTCGAKPYQVLKHLDTSPQLPSGYLGMIFLALVPPLWHTVMDKRALNYRNKAPVETVIADHKL